MYEVCLKSTGILIFINTKINSHKDVFFKYFSPNDTTSSHIGVPAISKCFKSPLELFPSQGFEFCLVVCASVFSESWNLPPLITNFSLWKKKSRGARQEPKEGVAGPRVFFYQPKYSRIDSAESAACALSWCTPRAKKLTCRQSIIATRVLYASVHNIYTMFVGWSWTHIEVDHYLRDIWYGRLFSLISLNFLFLFIINIRYEIPYFYSFIFVFLFFF